MPQAGGPGPGYFYIWEALENKTAWPPASEAKSKSVGKGRVQKGRYIILPSLNCIVNLLGRKRGFGGERRGLRSEGAVEAGFPPPGAGGLVQGEGAGS